MTNHLSERALILTPVGRDASVAAAMLRETGIEPSICADLPSMVRELETGAGMVIVAEEALTADQRELRHWIEQQPPWSDMSFVLLTQRGGGLERNPGAARHLEALGNVTFLERPFHPTTLISLVHAAIRGRRRQYDARARLEDLRLSEMRYRQIVEGAEDFAIISLDEGGVVTSWNTGAARITQFAESDALGRSADFLFTPEDRAADVPAQERARARQDGQAADERWHLTKAGFRFWASGAMMPLDPVAGGFLKIFRDRTSEYQAELAVRQMNETLEERVRARTAELEQAQEALRQSQKLEALGTLTGGVAHDFNNLLTPIIGSLDMLQRRVSGERESRLIVAALQSAERAQVLVHRLLAFARRQPLQPRSVDLSTLVAGMADLVASTSGPRVELRLAVPADLPPVHIDPHQLEMAILNLAVNSRDAMPNGGQLAIEAAAVDLAADEAGGGQAELRPGRYIHLRVTDTGAGMDEETLARAVEPFFSTKGIGRGTGLGLSMVHGLAAQLGGALRISSVLGEGTTISIWLPISKDQVVVEDETVDAKTDNHAGLVMLVDDEPLIRMSTADMLQDLGYAVVEASSAEAALELLEAGPAPNLLITDHLMPGMTGTELGLWMRQYCPQTPVLLISGYADGDGISPDIPRLTKPFRERDLVRMVTELLGDPAAI